MSRRRYISTDISTDPKVAELAEYGTLPILLYTWAIPHMDDWGRLIGEPRQFKLMVCPGLDITASQVQEALAQIASVGLWLLYEVEGKQYISIASERWFRYQTYINKAKRVDDSGSNIPPPPTNDNERRKTPKKAVSPSPTPSPSPSPTPKDRPVSPARDEAPEEDESVGLSVSGIDQVNQHYHKHIGMMGPSQESKLRFWLNEQGMHADVICYAIDEAVNANKRRMSYVEGILRNLFNDGIRTLNDIKERDGPQSQAEMEAYIAQIAAGMEE